MPIAKDTEDLSAMLFGTSGTNTKKQSQQVNIEPEPEDSPMNPEPVISYDYQNEMKEIRKRSRKTVSYLSKLVLPDDMLEEDYVKDKIEQDINTLAELYWARRSNELMKLSIMDSIAKGNTAPRMYDVYKAITDQINDNNKQLLATEDNLRKTYTELKYDIQRKRTEELSFKEELNPSRTIGAKETKAIEATVSPSQLTHKGTKSLIEEMKNRQREAYKAMSEPEL